MLGAALAVVARAALVAEQRAAWTLIAVGFVAWVAGDLFYDVVLAERETIPYPSLTDALYLVLYVCSLAGLRLLGGRVAGAPLLSLGLVVTLLGLATIWSRVVFDQVVGTAEGSVAAVATTLAYPLFDLVLLATIALALASRGWQRDPQLILLAAGFGLIVVADSVFAVEVASDSYVQFGPLDMIWPAGALLVGVAAWSRAGAPGAIEERSPGASEAVTARFSVAAMTVATGVLVFDHFSPVDLATFVLACLTVTAGLAQLLTLSRKRQQADAQLVRAERLRSASMDSAFDCVITFDADGRVCEWNRAAEATFGYSRERAIGRDLFELIIPRELRGKAETLMNTAAAEHQVGPTAECWETIAVASGGRRFPAEISIARIDSAPPMFAAYLRDISERRRTQRETDRLAAIVRSSEDALFSTDRDGVITAWNFGAERIYGYHALEAIGASFEELILSGEERRLVHQGARAVLAGDTIELDACGRRRDGESINVSLRAFPMRDGEGDVVGISVNARDVTEQRRDEAKSKSDRDYLRSITETMGEGMFALDPEGRLTFLNPAGERLLGWTEDELRGEVMHDLTHYERPDGSAMPRESCPILLARRDGTTIRISDDVFVRKNKTKLPVAYTAAPFETPEGVRGSVIVFSDITERKRQERALQTELDGHVWVGKIRRALAEDRLLTYAQPVIDLSTGETIAHELLVRMQGDGDEIIGPASFLPAAEQDGVITEIDQMMLRRAVGFAAEGHEVAVNVSAHSVGEIEVLEELRSGIEETGADASKIIIELTETALVGDVQAAAAFVGRCKNMGCRLALDDFGTGYGGFTYLKRLPVDILKIDMEFVHDLMASASSQNVVTAVVALAASFGQTTIAEGVEDEETAQALRDLGVDFAQGYFYARPRPATEGLIKGDLREHAIRES